MAKASIFMGIICIGVIGGAGVFGCGGVRELMSPSQGVGRLPRLAQIQPRNDNPTRSRVLNIARAELGVRELTGKNDGKRIAEYLAYTGIKVPAAWCASYVSFCFWKAGYTQPKTAWSPVLFPASRIVAAPKPADVFGIYFADLNRIAHVGFVERLQGDFIQTLEGNTNVEGSREGQGVYRRFRHKRTIYQYANWLD